jgi:hypothetical protein
MSVNNSTSEYGVTHPSVLLDITAYSMFNGGLLHKVMYNLFEGIVWYELKYTYLCGVKSLSH